MGNLSGTNQSERVIQYETPQRLGIAQESAWYMLHRVREGLIPRLKESFNGPVELDEIYIGGLEKI